MTWRTSWGRCGGPGHLVRGGTPLVPFPHITSGVRLADAVLGRHLPYGVQCGDPRAQLLDPRQHGEGFLGRAGLRIRNGIEHRHGGGECGQRAGDDLTQDIPHRAGVRQAGGVLQRLREDVTSGQAVA